MSAKAITIVFLTLFFSVSGSAQNGKDTVYFFGQDNKRITQQLLLPISFDTEKLNNYGFLQLDYKKESGGLRRAQEAFSVTSPKFLAKGFNHLGRFKIAGSFEFDKTFEDSLANGQKNNLEDLTTHYPYANKSGNYERQNYLINTSLSYRILNNQLIPFISMDYHKHWSTGSVDPRLNTNRFIFKLKPGIGIRYKKHAVALYGIFGKADEEVSLMYKNSSTKVNVLYPDRIHYMNYGYGSSVIKDSSSVYKYDRYRGGGIHYITTLMNWNTQFSAEYQSYRNENSNVTRSSRFYNVLSLFRLNMVSGSILLSKTTNEKNNQQFAADVVYQDGYDGNLKTSGSLDRVNYKVHSLNFNAAYDFLWDKNRKTSKELGLAFSYFENEKQDLGQSSGLAVQQLQLRIQSNVYHRIDAQSNFKLSLSPYGILPIKAELKYNPNSMNEFIRNVIFTDYFFYNSKAVGALIKGEYASSKLIKSQHIGFYTQLDIRNQLEKQGRADLNPTFIPNHNRAIFHIGINMYL